MRTVAFFNHKGGVGKTTLIYNIGLAFAQEGGRVLFLDADPQANLTSAAVDIGRIEEALTGGRTIHSAVKPVVDGYGDFAPIEPLQIRDRAWLLPGDLRLSEFEEIAPQGWTDALAGHPRGFRVSMLLHRLIEYLAEQLRVDLTLVDMAPNVGALNRTALLSSDGFVVPLAPDLFSITALPSVGRSAARWVEEWVVARESAERRKLDLGFDLPVGKPSPLGYVSQQFAIYRERPAAAFKRWIDRIPEEFASGIVEPLKTAGVPLPEGEHHIGEVPNLSSLVPIAQRTNQAIFELSGSEARGAHHTKAVGTYSLFVELANQIQTRTDSLPIPA